MADAAVVLTDSGPVRGTMTDDYRLFQGIPYAASTAGALRWRPPQPVRPWTQVRDADRPGPMCPQQPSSYAEVASLAEDCLCLNVIIPRADPQQPRPVMVWIHGDGAIGAGSFFDARRLATIGDVVVVTINYRLGIFGAFGYPGLEGSGAFGLQDQQAALRWVQRNAAAFGGDPGNVTVFGESYGGLSTSAHLVAPGSAGLFHRAIVQSGFALMDLPAGGIFPGLPAVAWYGWRASAEVEALGAAVAASSWGAPMRPRRWRACAPCRCRSCSPMRSRFSRTGSATACCLRSRPRRSGTAGSIGCRSSPAAPATSTGCSSACSACWPGNRSPPEQYPALLAEAFGEHADRVQASYPLSAYRSPNLAWATVLTDRMWARSTFEQHRLLAQQVPAYAYEFADRTPRCTCRSPKTSRPAPSTPPRSPTCSPTSSSRQPAPPTSGACPIR